MQGNVWIEDIFQEILLIIPKHYSKKQEPSSRRDHQHFSTKLHPIKKITEVWPGTCLQNSKPWRTNRSAISQLPLRTTSAQDLLQRLTTTLSSSVDLSTWCNPTSSVGRHTKMLVLISNTSWRFAAHSPYQESPEMLYYFASSHSHCWEREVLTPFLGTCPGWQDRVAVRCGLLMRMVADEGEVECD